MCDNKVPSDTYIAPGSYLYKVCNWVSNEFKRRLRPRVKGLPPWLIPSPTFTSCISIQIRLSRSKCISICSNLPKSDQAKSTRVGDQWLQERSSDRCLVTLSRAHNWIASQKCKCSLKCAKIQSVTTKKG